MTTPLSPKEYVKNPRCPICRSADIECEMDWNGNDSQTMVNEGTCLDCQATWNEIYKLTGYTDLEPGEEETV